jgi:hypothetical protein
MHDDNHVYQIEGKSKDLRFQVFRACIAKIIVSGLLHRVGGSFSPKQCNKLIIFHGITTQKIIV